MIQSQNEQRPSSRTRSVKHRVNNSHYLPPSSNTSRLYGKTKVTVTDFIPVRAVIMLERGWTAVNVDMAMLQLAGGRRSTDRGEYGQSLRSTILCAYNGC